jgi:ABC-2 type transport system permease protein
MNGPVFFETLRRSWKGMVYWGVGLGLMAWLQTIIVPDVEALKKMADLMESLPPFLLQAFGTTDITFMTTPEGYMTLQWFSWIVLILAVYAVLSGLNVTANEEERGTMDILLSMPIPRWRVVVEKSLAYTVLIAGIIVLNFLGLWLGVIMTPALSMDTGKLAASTFNMFPPVVLILAFTVLMGTLARRRSVAAALAAVFVVASYFVDTLGKAASETVMNTVRAVSFYSYYDPVTVMQNGLPWANVIGLLVVAVLLVFGAVWAFQRRDINI